MTHLSGGAISGIAFGVALFVFCSASLALWWRRVYRDHYSKEAGTWGGSWGVKAQQELQEKLDRQRREQARAKAAAEMSPDDIEMVQQHARELDERSMKGEGPTHTQMSTDAGSKV